MLLDLRIPFIDPHMDHARVEVIHVTDGAVLISGQKLLDFSVDLSNAFPLNCPPVSYYRVVLRETVWLRGLHARPGRICAPDELIALLSTEAHEALDAPVARKLRVMTAAIFSHAGMWSAAGT